MECAHGDALLGLWSHVHRLAPAGSVAGFACPLNRLAEYRFLEHTRRHETDQAWRCALRTLIRLGVAQKLDEGVLSVSTLAEGEHLPFKFLEAILFELRRVRAM